MPPSGSATTISVVVGTVVSCISVPLFYQALRYFADYIFGVKRSTEEEQDGLHVLIKTADKTVPIFLSPKWSICEVKRHLANAVGKDSEDLRIIVAGHELRDDVMVGDCDLGESTVIHAVKVLHRPTTFPPNQNIHAQQEEFVKNLELAQSLANTTVDESDNSSFSQSSLKGDKPMNECLLDLQLTEEERIRFERDNIQDLDLTTDIATTDRNDNVKNEITDMKPIHDENIKNRIKAHFWVYCSQIGCGRTIQPGKLRVRCAACKEGAIIVKSDPCNWEDVLTSERIEGYCQNNDCSYVEEGVNRVSESARVRAVEFYFKCYGNNHRSKYQETAQPNSYTPGKSFENDPAISEAPPLYLIRSNLKEIPCLGKFPGNMYFEGYGSKIFSIYTIQFKYWSITFLF